MSVSEFLPRLFPPKIGATPETVNRWQWFVFFAIVALSCGLGAGYVTDALAFGRWPTIFPGFATTADARSVAETASQQIKGVIAKQNESALRQIRQDLLLNVKARCDAIKHKSSAVGTYTEQIETLELEYWKLTGVKYNEPTCDQV